MEKSIRAVAQEKIDVSDIPIGAVKMNVGSVYEMDDLAQRLVGVAGQLAMQTIIEKAEIFTEERNGETISLTDVAKAVKEIERNKRNEDSE